MSTHPVVHPILYSLAPGRVRGALGADVSIVFLKRGQLERGHAEDRAPSPASPKSQPDEADRSFLDVVIDELALYNPLLDAESVESHYRSQYRRLTEQA